LHLLVHWQSLPLLQDLPVVGRVWLGAVSLEWVHVPAHDLVDLVETDSTGHETFQGVLAAGRRGRRSIVAVLRLKVDAVCRERWISDFVLGTRFDQEPVLQSLDIVSYRND
jgi:hypothetical protein